MKLIIMLMFVALGIPAYSAEIKGDIIRVHGVRFILVKMNDFEIFIPTEENISDNERIARSFCMSHLNGEDAIKMREETINLREEDVSHYVSRCKSADAKKQIPEKQKDNEVKQYDHGNAKSVKSVIDHLIKK